MGEPTGLKAGDTATYDVGNKKITLKPVTLGKMKKAMAVFQNKKGETFDMMIDHLQVILDNGENKFATREWLEDNLTMPVATKIVNDMRVVNGIGQSFLDRGEPKGTPEVRDLSGQATPSA